MAELNKRGYLGGFRGQLGSAYGTFWRLLELIKAMPRKSGKAPTHAQLMAQVKMAIIAALLAKIASYVKSGYQHKVKPGQAPMNLATSYNLKNAMTGVAPNFTIDYPKLRYSEGTLDQLEDTAVTAAADQVLNFSWAQGDLDTGSATDLVKVLAYCPVKEKFVKVEDGVPRSAMEYELQMPLNYAGEVVHCYICVASADGKKVATNQYVGQAIVL